MATFRKRGELQWETRVRRKGYPEQSSTFESRAQAQAWARQIEAAMDRGVFVSRAEAERTTLAEALERYAREVSPRKKNAAREQDRIEWWKRQPVARRTLATIRGKDMADFIHARASQGKAPNTIRLDLALLSHLFTVARTAWGMESLINPVELARAMRPKLPHGRERRFYPEEEEKLLAAARAYETSGHDAGPMASIIAFAVETAMRRGEIAAMKWVHVNRAGSVLKVPETKSGEPRKAPLSSRTLKILNALPRRLDGQVWGMRPDSITGAFARIVSTARAAYESQCKDAGIEPDPGLLVALRFHDLRHEAISRLFERGLNPMQVAAISGHKTLQMLKRYTHLRVEDLVALLG